jgi:DnaJ family protein A protein 2
LIFQQPDTVPGDVVVVLQQQQHDKFERKGLSLKIKKEITLLEALTGFTFYIQHLDGRVLRVKSDPGQVYKPGTIKVINNEGMPQAKNHFLKGSLYVEFAVQFPATGSLSQQAIQALSAALPHPRAEAIPIPKKNPIDMTDTDNEDNNTNAANKNSTEGTVNDIEDVHLNEFDLAEEKSRMEEEEGRREAYEDDDEEGHAHGRQAGCRTQ